MAPANSSFGEPLWLICFGYPHFRVPLCPKSLWRLENMILYPQICVNEPKFLGKFNCIVDELSPKYELHQTRIELMPPFSATRAFFNSGTQVPPKCQIY